MSHSTEERIVRPARNLRGSLRLPGDKSISHRYGMLAAFAQGTSRFRNFSTGADCASTLACMRQLGARVNRTEEGVVEVTGVAGRTIPSAEPLDCGNSGSTMRMLSGLLAGLQTAGVTTVRESVRTRDHSELALKAFGARIEQGADWVSITGPQTLHAIEGEVPGDISSAAFFLAAAALFPGSRLVLPQLGLNPTRAALLDVLAKAGLKINILELQEKNCELVGTVEASGPAELGAISIEGAVAAQLIDELPVLAAIAPFTGGIRIRDARELRVKESDRIALVVKNLRAMGAEVQEFEDGMDVAGNQTLHGAQIDSSSDHRIAMAFSVAALRASSENRILGAESAAISFPEFFDLLDELAER